MTLGEKHVFGLETPKQIDDAINGPEDLYPSSTKKCDVSLKDVDQTTTQHINDMVDDVNYNS